MKKIVFFPANWPLNEARKTYFEQAGYFCAPYQQTELATDDILLLVTPVRDDEGNWISPETVWKKYLSTHFPNLKVIQAGSNDDITGKNYLNWFELPVNFEAFVANAAPAKDWVPYDTQGDNLGETWAKFLDGHDKSGFTDWFIVAKRRTGISYEHLSQNPASFDEILTDYLNDPDTLEAFENMQSRWQRYKFMFSADPRQEELTAFENQLNQLNTGWQDCKNPEQLLERLKTLNTAFTQLDTLKEKF